MEASAPQQCQGGRASAVRASRSSMSGGGAQSGRTHNRGLDFGLDGPSDHHRVPGRAGVWGRLFPGPILQAPLVPGLLHLPDSLNLKRPGLRVESCFPQTLPSLCPECSGVERAVGEAAPQTKTASLQDGFALPGLTAPWAPPTAVLGLRGPPCRGCPPGWGRVGRRQNNTWAHSHPPSTSS